MNYEIASQPSEVVVKHGVTTNVQSITAELYLLPKEPGEAVGDRPGEKLTSDEGDGACKRSFVSIGEQIPAHPLAEIKANRKKQSFASLSSLQPSSSFTGSLKRRTHPLSNSSNSSVLMNDAFTLKWPSADTKSTSEKKTAADAAGNSSMSNASWSPTGANHQHFHNSTTAERRSTLTTESTHVASTTKTPFVVGNHKTPVTKWYMKVKPTEMKADSGRIKPKVLPQELIRRHHKIAFIGIMHDNLSKAFINILKDDPQHRWDQVFVLFPSDDCLKNTLVQNYSMLPAEKLIENKIACRSTLHEILSPVVSDLRFLQYDQLMH